MNFHYHLIEERQSENLEIYGVEEKIMGAKSNKQSLTSTVDWLAVHARSLSLFNGL